MTTSRALVQRRRARRVAVPEPAPRPPDVPVGQVVDERRRAAGRPAGCRTSSQRRGRPRATSRCASESTHRSSTRAVGRRGAGLGDGVQPFASGVQGEEGRGVPVGQQRLADDLLQRRVADPARQPRRAAGGHEPAQRVGAVLVHQRDRLAGCCPGACSSCGRPRRGCGRGRARSRSDERSKHQRADRHQRVEPAAGLVDRLADELRRVGLARTSPRRPARAGSPTGRTASSPSRTSASMTSGTRRTGRPALRAGERDVVDVRPVRVERGQVLPGQLAELGQRPDARSGAPSSAHRQIGSGVPQ